MQTTHRPYTSLLLSLLGLTAMISFGSCGKNDHSPASTLQITTFSPSSGIKGTRVVIKGSGFSPSHTGNTVTFNGKGAVITAATATSITAEVPLLAGDGKIAVQVGSKDAHSANDFSYVYSVSTIAGNGLPSFAEGAGPEAMFDHPLGVFAGADETIYVADGENQRIRKITSTEIVSTLAGDGTRGWLNATGATSRFNFPFGLVQDATGNIFVAESDNNQVRKITPQGVVSTFAGDTANGYKDATGKDARFYSPAGIAIDGDGNLYVSDYSNQRIRKITPAGVVTTLAGDGTAGYKDGPSGTARFNSPQGMAVDRAGNIYVADGGNNMIRMITPAGEVRTLAGNKSGGFKDATGSAAQFINPLGIAVDATGNVYVADWGNHRIRKVTPAGVVTTVAGDGQLTFGDGPAQFAHFKYPSGVALDPAGVIYVADQDNNRIRKVE